MGGVCGVEQSELTTEEKSRQMEIEKMLREDKKRFDLEIKILLLGTGESGKSTIAKQLKLLYLQGFSSYEKAQFKEVIHSNIVLNMHILCKAATSLLGLKIEPENEARAAALGEPHVLQTQVVDLQLADTIKHLWKDKGIQEAYARRREFQLSDSAEYFFERVDACADPMYIPSEQDIIRAHAKTSGVCETEFQIKRNFYRLVDVGGQRSERKKWIHCFQSVTSIIFCVALSEYDTKLYEDETVLRMHESVKLFEEIANSRWFAHVSFMLFFNKDDLFRPKARSVDLSICFPEYTGGLHYSAALAFIQDKFKKLFEANSPRTTSDLQKRGLYIHVTTATNTENIKFVFESVRDTILNECLFESGF